MAKLTEVERPQDLIGNQLLPISSKPQLIDNDLEYVHDRLSQALQDEA